MYNPDVISAKGQHQMDRNEAKMTYATLVNTANHSIHEVLSNPSTNDSKAVCTRFGFKSESRN